MKPKQVRPINLPKRGKLASGSSIKPRRIIPKRGNILTEKGKLINSSFVNPKETTAKRIVLSKSRIRPKSKINFARPERRFFINLEKLSASRLKAFFAGQGITRENVNSAFFDVINEGNSKSYKAERQRREKYYERERKRNPLVLVNKLDYDPKITITPTLFLNIGDALNLSTREIINAHNRYVKSYNPNISPSDRVYTFLGNTGSLFSRINKPRPDMIKAIVEEYGIRDGFWGVYRDKYSSKLLQLRSETKKHNMAGLPENLVNSIAFDTLVAIEESGVAKKHIVNEFKKYSEYPNALASKGINKYLISRK